MQPQIAPKPVNLLQEIGHITKAPTFSLTHCSRVRTTDALLATYGCSLAFSEGGLLSRTCHLVHQGCPGRHAVCAAPWCGDCCSTAQIPTYHCGLLETPARVTNRDPRAVILQFYPPSTGIRATSQSYLEGTWETKKRALCSSNKHLLEVPSLRDPVVLNEDQGLLCTSPYLV